MRAFIRPGVSAFGIGAGMGAVLSAWNIVGMYTAISIATWDVWRQVLFVLALAGTSAVAAHIARARRGWVWPCTAAVLAALGCAATVVSAYALTTGFGAARIRQVPEFIRDYTHHGYTSPSTYFADHYWPLLELQVFTWIIGAACLAGVGAAVGLVRAPHGASSCGDGVEGGCVSRARRSRSDIARHLTTARLKEKLGL